MKKAPKGVVVFLRGHRRYFYGLLGRSPDSEWFEKVLSQGSLSAEATAKIEDRKLRISKTDNWPDHFPLGLL